MYKVRVKYMKNKKIKWIGLAAICAIVVLIIAFFVSEKSKIDIKDYITMQYTGANGYATADCQINREKLYSDMAGDENDLEKLKLYRDISENISVFVDHSNPLSNGDKVLVKVEYSKQLVQNAKVKFANKQFFVKAKGIEEGQNIDLFSMIEVTFAGISPRAYAVVQNNWQEPYLSTLSFSVDKSNGIAKDDVITVQCDTDMETLAKHGFITDKIQQSYKADKLSTYVVDGSEIDKNELDSLKTMCVEAVDDMTKDTTFRMMYKATGNSDYLYQPNNEYAENISVIGVKFLYCKNTAEEMYDNFLYILCEADIINEDECNKVYFGFEFAQVYKTFDGKVHISTEHYKKNYECSTQYNDVYKKCIESKSNIYNIKDYS